MKKRENRLLSRTFSILQSAWAEKTPYTYGFISEIDCLSREDLLLCLKRMEEAEVPYRIAKSGLFHVSKGKDRDLKRFARRFVEDALEICLALLMYLPNEWAFSTVKLAKYSVRAIQDKKEQIEKAVEIVQRIEKTKKYSIREEASERIGHRCSPENIIHAIEKLSSSVGYMKCISDVLSEVYVHKEGKEYFMRLKSSEDPKKMLLYVHTLYLLFKKKKMNMLDYCSVAGDTVERMLFYPVEKENTSRKKRHLDRIKGTKLYGPKEHRYIRRKLLKSILYFLGASFHFGWMPNEKAKEIVEMLFSQFEEKRNIDIIRTISKAKNLLEKKAFSFYSIAGVSHISGLLERKLNKYETAQVEPAATVLASMLSAENSHMFSNTALLKLLDEPFLAHKKIPTILSKFTTSERILFLFEQAEANYPLFPIVILSFYLAEIEIPENVFNRYRILLQDTKRLSNMHLENSPSCFMGILPAKNRLHFSYTVLEWAYNTLLSGISSEYICTLIAGCSLYTDKLLLLENIFLLLLGFADESPGPMLFRSLQSILTRIMDLKTDSSNKKLLADLVFRLPGWIDKAHPILLPSVYTLAIQIHPYSYFWKEWDNTALAATDRIYGYAPNKAAKESLLIGRTASIRTIDKVLKKIDRCISNPKASNSAIKSLYTLSTHGHIEKVLLYLSERYAFSGIDRKPYYAKILARVIKKAGSNGHSCRGLSYIWRPVIEDTLLHKTYSLRRSACFLACSLVSSCWGMPEDYQLAVYLFNWIFPLIYEPVYKKDILPAILLFTVKLSPEFVLPYLSPGLIHPDSRIRAIHQEVYSSIIKHTYIDPSSVYKISSVLAETPYIRWSFSRDM